MRDFATVATLIPEKRFQEEVAWPVLLSSLREMIRWLVALWSRSSHSRTAFAAPDLDCLSWGISPGSWTSRLLFLVQILCAALRLLIAWQEVSAIQTKRYPLSLAIVQWILERSWKYESNTGVCPRLQRPADWWCSKKSVAASLPAFSGSALLALSSPIPASWRWSGGASPQRYLLLCRRWSAGTRVRSSHPHLQGRMTVISGARLTEWTVPVEVYHVKGFKGYMHCIQRQWRCGNMPYVIRGTGVVGSQTHAFAGLLQTSGT